MTDGQLCLLCAASNKRSFLHSYQINLDEAIVLCENPQCSYPVGSTNYCVTYSRSFNHIEISKPKDVCTSVPEAQVALQTRMAGYARSSGKTFRSVVGKYHYDSGYLSNSTQTDSRPNSRSNSLSGSKIGPKPGSFTFKNGSRSGPITNPNSLQLFSSNHSKPLEKLNGLTNGIPKEKGCANSADRISPCSSTESETKVFAGFTFSSKNNGSLQRQISKSEPPLQKFKLDTKVGAKVVSKSDKLRLSISENNPRSGNTTPCSSSSTESLKHRNSLLKQAKQFFNYPRQFVQWRNKDALCWLDAVQCLLVHNRHVRETVFGENFDQDVIIFKLLQAHDQAQKLLELVKTDSASSVLNSEINRHEIHESSQNGSLKKLNAKSELTNQEGLLNVKTGAGNIESDKIMTNGSEHDDGPIDNSVAMQVEEKLNSVREEVWQELQPKLQFERGQNDSPVFTMSSLIRDNPIVEKLFKLKYSFWVQCSKCGYAERENFEKVLPTLPGVVKDFQITEPSHAKTCALCGYSDARRTLVYEQLSECLLMHFTEGLPHNHWRKLDFSYHGNLYAVTGVVQYINNPDHFIAWLRDPIEGHWLRCDDLQPTVCTFQPEINVPPGQIHMVMWEKVPVQKETCQNETELHDQLTAQVVEGTGPFQNGDIETKRNGVDKGLLSKAFTELRVHESAQNGDIATTNHVYKANVIDSSQPMPSSGNTSILTRASEIPSGRFNVPKAGSSSLSSTCSDLSEDLPEFAALLPSVPVARPVPCHLNVLNGDTEEAGFNGDTQTKESGDKARGFMNELKTDLKAFTNDYKTDLIAGVNGLGPTKYTNDKLLNTSSARLRGEKPILEASTVFCAPRNLDITNAGKEKPEKKAVVNVPIYPPFSVQKTANPSEKKTDDVSCVSEMSSVTKSSLNQEKEKARVNNLQPVVVLARSEDKNSNDSKKGVKTKFTPGHKLEKQRSLFTYMRGNKKPNAPVMRKDAFMTLNLVKEKSKSQGQSNFILPSTPVAQLTTDGNVSYLGKVQQYLMNNKISFGDSKFDGLQLKSRSETCMDQMTIRTDKNSRCNSRLVSPMSEWFGRKVNSPTKSTYSTNLGAVKRKSLAEAVENARKVQKTCKEIDNINQRGTPEQLNGGIDNGNGTVTISDHSNINKNQITVSNGQENKGVPNTDCVLQDLYEALNIPFDQVGSTMANIMSDVDDILDFMKPSESTPDLSPKFSRVVHSAKPLGRVAGQLAFSNG